MADPKVPADKAPAAAAAPAETTTTEERVVPKFSEVVAERTAARQGEIAATAGQPAAAAEPPAGEPALPAEVSDEEYSKWWDAQPENLRNATVKRAYTSYNNAIAADYGDILPTVLAAKESPELRALLVELGDSTKKELLSYVTDPEIRKHAKELTKAELRDFLFGEATTTFNKYNTAPAAGEPAADPRDARIQALESKFDEEQTGREYQTYVATRGNEVRAVRSAFGHMSDAQIAHVVQVTEGRFETAAARKGIDTTKEGWAARAVRAGVVPPSYRDYAAEYSEVLGRQTPPVAPATTPTGDKGAAAPRDATEAKKLAGVTALRDFKAKDPRFKTSASRR